MEKLIELKEKFEKMLKEALNQINVKLDKGYLTITAKLTPDEVVSLRDNFFDLNELGVSIRVKFDVLKVRVKDSTNKYIQIDKAINIDYVLSSNNFQVNKDINWTDASGIKQTAKITSFQISLFTEYTTASNLEVSFIETVIE